MRSNALTRRHAKVVLPATFSAAELHAGMDPGVLAAWAHPANPYGRARRAPNVPWPLAVELLADPLDTRTASGHESTPPVASVMTFRHRLPPRKIDCSLSFIVGQAAMKTVEPQVMSRDYLRSAGPPVLCSKLCIGGSCFPVRCSQFCTRRTRTLRRGIQGLAGHILGTLGHKPGESQRITNHVISQVTGTSAL